jgi:hypothetical protein
MTQPELTVFRYAKLHLIFSTTLRTPTTAWHPRDVWFSDTVVALCKFTASRMKWPFHLFPADDELD